MRQYSTIAIKDPQTNATRATVPITESSTRKWKLMEEDSVTLDFVLKNAVEFTVGDYIEDELFGKFQLTEEPVPAEYNNESGGYRYQLRFDREYIAWKNQTFQLTAVPATYGAQRKRTTAQWSLTDKLETHVQEFERNLQILGYSPSVNGTCCAYAYCIDGQTIRLFDSTPQDFSEYISMTTDKRFSPVANRDAMAFISYSGTSLFDALKAMCDAYSCEWWVMEYTHSSFNQGKPFPVLCFGKCEFGTSKAFKMTPVGGDHLDFIDSNDKDVQTGDTPNLDLRTADFAQSGGVINVEKMSVNRNEQQYANRLYVYGSTKNIPDTYRKKLEFTVTDYNSSNLSFKDNNRLLSSKNFGIKDQEVNPTAEWQGGNVGTDYAYMYSDFAFSQISGIFDVNMDFVLIVYGSRPSSGPPSAKVRIRLYLRNQMSTPLYDEDFVMPYTRSFYGELQFDIVHTAKNVFVNESDRIYIRVDVEDFDLDDGTYEYAMRTGTYGGHAEFVFSPVDVKVPCAIYVNNVLYQCFLNYNPNTSGTTKGWFQFRDNTYPSGFGVGSKFTVKETDGYYNTLPVYGLREYTVPSNYFTDTENTANDVVLIGERRLMLPVGTPYVDPDESITLKKLIEKVVIFDAIYPRCCLRIVKVIAKEGEIKAEEYNDGTVRYEKTANYFIAVKRVSKTSSSDVDFPLDSDMQIPGEDLKVTFLTKEEEMEYTYDGESHGAADGYQLSGLTFVVGFSAFTDDQGNSYQGFQMQRNKDYGATFPNLGRFPVEGDTLFLSGWNPKAMAELGLITDAEQELLTAAESYKEALQSNQFTFDCSMMSNWAEQNGVQRFGQRVRVYHEAIDGQYRDSRIIGYQLRLDIPENTPVYTVGETEKYSRLNELERKLNAQSRNASASGAINATGGGGGGGVIIQGEKQYNIKIKATGYAAGQIKTIDVVTENYDADLLDSSLYRMFLLRWRNGEWKAARLSPTLNRDNAIAEAGIDSWNITSNKQEFLNGQFSQLNIDRRWKARKQQYVFKASKQTRLKIGCAIYKYTGEGHHGWQRVSNIAYVSLGTTTNYDKYKFKTGEIT